MISVLEETKETKETKEVVRTVADRIATEGRRARREINGTIKHLALDQRIIDELGQKGHLYWANDNDTKLPLSMLEDLGYRYVTNREAFGEAATNDPDGKVKVRYGVADTKGTPQDIYLMSQPWEFYNEDRKQIEQANNMLDKKIHEEGKTGEIGYGHSIKYNR